MKQVTQTRLKELLKYSKATGDFSWISVNSNVVRIGEVAGYNNGAGYIKIGIDGRRYYAHRLAFLYVTGKLPKRQVDHKNGDRSDNRWCNLRDATNGTNRQNLKGPKCNNTCGFLGVYWHKAAKKYCASIKTNGVTRYLGLFPSAEAASSAYLTAKRKLHIACTI